MDIEETMVHLTVDIGGRPGVDCRGFCAYCYFKHVKDVPPFGCRYCLPFLKGCDYCSRGVKEEYSGFLPLRTVAESFLADLQMVTEDVTRITISGGGDPSCYPDFRDLVELLGTLDIPLHIGYTSGKGFDEPEIADFLVENHLTEVSFTVFAADAELRKKWMHDPTPEASLEIIRRLAKKIDVYAAVVVLPDVNDGDVLTKTLSWLSDIGVKGVILMRLKDNGKVAAVALAPQEDIDPDTPSGNGTETADNDDKALSATENVVAETQNVESLDYDGTDASADEVADAEEIAEVDSVVGDLLDGEE